MTPQQRRAREGAENGNNGAETPPDTVPGKADVTNASPVMPALPGQPSPFTVGAEDHDAAVAAALPYAGTVDASGRELSDAERQRTAASIEEAVRAHTSWRETLPLPVQLATMDRPIVSVPPEGE